MLNIRKRVKSTTNYMKNIPEHPRLVLLLLSIESVSCCLKSKEIYFNLLWLIKAVQGQKIQGKKLINCGVEQGGFKFNGNGEYHLLLIVLEIWCGARNKGELSFLV